MNREEAVSLIREINQECESIRGTSIMLMTPQETEIPSKGYQVHLLMKADRSRLRCLETITEQYGYVIESDREKSLVIIYNPTKKGKQKSTESGRA